MEQYDVIIVGGGIVGLATAWQLLQEKPGLRLAILEKESRLAMHQSSRNSGVIHSGIYYKPGSLRAVNCARGYHMLIEFCHRHELPFELCGKVIVAVEPAEQAQLKKILDRGIANGLTGIQLLSREETLEREPHVQAVESIWVPQAGITDYGMIARKYGALLDQAGATIRTNAAVCAYKKRGKEVRVATSDWEASASLVINCGGLYADKLAQLTHEKPPVQILPFRGEFYALKPERQHLVRNLIYPVPNPNFPFLGVHFTRMIHGGIEAGPNAVLAFRQEGYSRWDMNPTELSRTLAFRGFRRLAQKHWKTGWQEMRRSFSKTQFTKALQRLIPEVMPEDLEPARSGVRAMACTPEGELYDDFLILECPGVINVCNAPSPAATASLAIGESIAKRALNKQLSHI